MFSSISRLARRRGLQANPRAARVPVRGTAFPLHWARFAASQSQRGGQDDPAELPQQVVAPQDEFDHDRTPAWLRWVETLVLLGLGIGTIVGTSAFDAWHMCIDPLAHLDFIARYSVAQIIPACAGKSLDPSVFLKSLGADPSTVLHPHIVVEYFLPEALEQVAAALGETIDPTSPSKVHGFSSPGDAYRAQLAVGMIHSTALRMVAAQTLLISTIVRLVMIISDASQEYQDSVRKGGEPPPAGVQERIVRLAGHKSDTTALSLSLHGPHIMPVFESQEEAEPLIETEWSKVGAIWPVYWRIDPSQYGSMRAWRGLTATTDGLVRTSTGRRLMVIEADCTNPEEALTMGQASADLDIDSASQGARLVLVEARRKLFSKRALMEIRRTIDLFGLGLIEIPLANVPQWLADPLWRLRNWTSPTRWMMTWGVDYHRDDSTLQMWRRFFSTKMATRPNTAQTASLASSEPSDRVATFRPFRVLLADSMQPVRSGGGATLTLRERVEVTKEFEVLLDSRAPILLALLRWLERVAAEVRCRRQAAEAEAGKAEADKAGANKAEEERGRAARATAMRAVAQQPVGPLAMPRSLANWIAHGMEHPVARGDKKSKDSDGEEAEKAGAAARRRTLQRFAASLATEDVDLQGQLLSGEAMLDDDQQDGLALLLDTSSEKYFEAIAQVLRSYGFRPLDAATVPHDVAVRTPRLIYHDTTAATVNAAYALVRAGVADPALCCVIVDRVDGKRELGELMLRSHERRVRKESVNDASAAPWRELARESEEAAAKADERGVSLQELEARVQRTPRGLSCDGQSFKSEFEVICAAEIHDQLFRQVRVWARAGFSAAQIQAELDRKFHPVLLAQES